MAGDQEGRLEKHFLTENRGLRVNTQQLITGFLLWIISAYILYAFMYMMKESLRFSTGIFNVEYTLFLTEKAHYFYNLFYASLASGFGYLFALNFVLQNVKKNSKSRLAIRRSLNDSQFYLWHFIAWFSKVALLFGICQLTYPLWMVYDFSSEHLLFLILFPIVLFLGSWPSFSRNVTHNKAKWFFTTLFIFFAMSTLMALKDFIDVERINSTIKSKSILSQFNLEIPRSISASSSIRRISFSIDVYVALDSTTETTRIFVEKMSREIPMGQLGEELKAELQQVYEWEHYLVWLNLIVDKKVPYSVIQEIKNVMKEVPIGDGQYVTIPKYTYQTIEYPLYKYHGIPFRIDVYIPSIEALLDSAELLNPRKYRLQVPGRYPTEALKEYNRLKLSVKRGQPFLNNTALEDQEIRDLLRIMIKRFGNQFVLLYEVDKDVSFEQYIHYLDLYFYEIKKLRREYCLRTYNVAYDDLDTYRHEYKETNKRYPLNLLELSEDDKRLLKLQKTYQ